MDDILILSHTRWQNRKAVSILSEYFTQLGLTKHPDKTFIGRIDQGFFIFFGYHFSRTPLQLASQTVRKHVERMLQL